MKQADKYLFGVFLNQARLNAYITLCHISDLLGLGTTEENSLAEMPVIKLLESEKDVLATEQAYNLFDKKFPMLKNICNWGKDDKTELSVRSKKYKEILTCLLKSLCSKRNEYCHAQAAKSDIDVKELCGYLNRCFDTSVNIVKDRRNLDDKEVFHLRRKASEGHGKNKQIIDNPAFHYHFIDKQGQLTENGLSFLATLFLDKKDTYEFLRKRSGFKRGESPAEKATLECFCVSRVNLPKPVVSSDIDKNGLALDMLNELKKCPRELLELLSKEHRNGFLDRDNEDEDGEETLMRRYRDRFSYFALRYCDENEVFDDIRFQIDLGKYYFRIYPKETIDGIEHQRSLDKRLKTFGRIREVKEKVKEQWDGIIKQPGVETEKANEPYKADTTPHYHLVDNQIGLVISGDHKLPVINPAGGKISLERPDAWISIYALPSMLFHGLQNGFKKTESRIEQYVKKQKEIIGEIHKTGTIPDKDKADRFLPEVFKDVETGDSRQGGYAGNKLERMIKETDDRIRAIKTTKQRAADAGNKPGKKNFFDIRAGRLADFLAKDIIALQRFDPAKKGKDKLTSMNFQVLQATLAYYGAKKDTIGDMFKRIGLLHGDNPHPFLKNIKPERYNSIVAFYEVYLDERLKYLKGCKEKGRLDDQFLRPSRKGYVCKRDLISIAKELRDKPVNIPNDFFEEDIRGFVCKEDSSLSSREMNIAYMIQAWFERTEGKQQGFYFYPKTYPVVKTVREYMKKRPNAKIVNVLKLISLEMSYKEMKVLIENEIPEGNYDPEGLRGNLLKGCKDFKDNERALRRYKLQDMIIFMMATETLKEQLEIGNNVLKLKDITVEEKSPFDKPIPYDIDIEVSFRGNVSYEAGYIRFIKDRYEDNYREKGGKTIVKYKLFSVNTKLKDVGKYSRYLHDRRLPGLLVWKHQPGSRIDFSDIEEEIKGYQQYRVKIAEQLYRLEKQVIDRLVSPEELSREDYIPFERVIAVVKGRLPDSTDKCDTLSNIRNAVNHNQFPAFEDVIEKAEGKTIAEKMCTVTEKYVNDIRGRLS